MWEKLLDKNPLPSIVPSEVLKQTRNYQIVTDYYPAVGSSEMRPAFFIDPMTEKGMGVLGKAAVAHNYFRFVIRPTPVGSDRHRQFQPALLVEYESSSLPPLFQGRVEIPEAGAFTIPSPDRMEQCIPEGNYSFSDGEPMSIPNPYSRRLKMLQGMYLDDIPDEIIHSTADNPYNKVRKGWWLLSIRALNNALRVNEVGDINLVARAEALSSKYSEFIRSSRVTTEQDIAAVNEIIDQIWNSQAK
jgi:hypothetical protein